LQHEFYHQYAADEHTLVCLEQLDKIWEALDLPYKNYAPLFSRLEPARPALPCVAAARCRQVRKPQEGRPSGGQRGDGDARGENGYGSTVRRRTTLRLIIENHLLMARPCPSGATLTTQR